MGFDYKEYLKVDADTTIELFPFASQAGTRVTLIPLIMPMQL
jgi:hypothetical protein